MLLMSRAATIFTLGQEQTRSSVGGNGFVVLCATCAECAPSLQKHKSWAGRQWASVARAAAAVERVGNWRCALAIKRV